MPSAATGEAVIDGEEGSGAAPALPANHRLLLRPEEAAEVLAIGRTKLFELLATGQLESVLIGTARRVPREAAERFVQSLERDGDVGPSGAA